MCDAAYAFAVGMVTNHHTLAAHGIGHGPDGDVLVIKRISGSAYGHTARIAGNGIVAYGEAFNVFGIGTRTNGQSIAPL